LALLNYSSTVPAVRTVIQMQELLAKHGASQILTEYAADGSVSGLAFAINGPVGLQRYRLPVDVSAVEKVLSRDRTIASRFKSREQAERVAWRILKDWLEAQLAIVATQMVTLDQVMLSYMLVGEGTVYDLYLNRQLELGSGDD